MGCTASANATAPRRYKAAKVEPKVTRNLSGEDLNRKQLTAPAAFKRLHFLPRRFEDDYSLDRKVLGSGYSGDVRLGRNKRTGARVAVKTFLVEHAKEKQIERALDEAEIYLALDHPHVVRLHDVYVEHNRLRLVMECMEGGELFEQICDKTFSQEDAAHSLRQMLTAVAYIHSQGIAHCDLKLENFLVEQKDGDWLKLCDFGFSQLFSPDAALYKQNGTMKYMSPGMLQGRYTNACDCWSIGVIAFALLTGRMPFAGCEEEICEKIMKGKWDRSNGLWAKRLDAFDFVKGLLELDPSKRLTAKQALAHPWLAKYAPVSATPLEPRMVESLRAFARCSPLQRVGFSTMAWTLSAAERSKVRQSFLAMNSSFSGTLTKPELSKALASHGVGDEEASWIFEALNMSGSGQVGYSDFLASMCISEELLSQQRLEEVFNCFDTSRCGLITVDGLRELSKSSQTLSTCVSSMSPTASLNSADFAAQLRSATSTKGIPWTEC